jgi:hypothetical protein
MSTDAHEWYWDLRRSRVVRADERGPADDTLGPYATRHEAEHWKDKVDERNKAWDDADDEWERGDSGGED